MCDEDLKSVVALALLAHILIMENGDGPLTRYHHGPINPRERKRASQGKGRASY